MRELLNKSPIWSGVGGFVERLISLFRMSCMCLIWLNINLFYRRLFLMMSLSLRAVMTCTLLYFPVSFWLDMASKTCWTDVGSFLPIMRIQTLVMFLSGNASFYGLLFYHWEIYDMLWCSQYYVTIKLGVPLGGKSTLPSNILYLIKGWSKRSILNFGRV